MQRHAQFNLIVACGKNGIIGHRGGLPWHLAADLKHFKQLTYGKTVVMGRKTWQSLPIQPLPGRENIVLTRNPKLVSNNAFFMRDEKILLQEPDEHKHYYIMGGHEVYKKFLPYVKTIYLTLVDTDQEGDVYFPAFDVSRWRAVRERTHAANANNTHAMEFWVLDFLADSRLATHNIGTRDTDSLFAAWVKAVGR